MTTQTEWVNRIEYAVDDREELKKIWSELEDLDGKMDERERVSHLGRTQRFLMDFEKMDEAAKINAALNQAK